MPRKLAVHTVAHPIEELESRTLLSGGPLEPSFGRNGILLGSGVGTPSSSDSGQTAMALQKDGKILLASPITRTGTDVQIARYKANGALDKKFGSAGKIYLGFDQVDVPTDLAMTPDGRILVLVRSSSKDLSVESTHLIRLQANGRCDKTFAAKGILSLSPRGYYRHIALPGDGTILVDDGTRRILRLTKNGKPDAKFGAKGVLTLSAPKRPSVPAGTTTQTDSLDRKTPTSGADQKLIALCQRDFIATDAQQQVIADVHKLAIYQYTAKGRLDKQFGSAGVAIIDMKAATGMAIDSVSIADFAVLPSGNILVAGHISTSSATGAGPDFVMRINANGTVDGTFGQQGFFWYDHRLTRIIPADDGEVVFTARLPQPQSQEDILVGRLSGDGTWQSAFGTGGSITIDFGAHDYAESLIEQPDGRLLLLATRSTITDDYEYSSRPAIACIGIDGHT